MIPGIIYPLVPTELARLIEYYYFESVLKDRIDSDNCYLIHIISRLINGKRQSRAPFTINEVILVCKDYSMNEPKFVRKRSILYYFYMFNRVNKRRILNDLLDYSITTSSDIDKLISSISKIRLFLSTKQFVMCIDKTPGFCNYNFIDYHISNFSGNIDHVVCSLFNWHVLSNDNECACTCLSLFVLCPNIHAVMNRELVRVLCELMCPSCVYKLDHCNLENYIDSVIVDQMIARSDSYSYELLQLETVKKHLTVEMIKKMIDKCKFHIDYILFHENVYRHVNIDLFRYALCKCKYANKLVFDERSTRFITSELLHEIIKNGKLYSLKDIIYYEDLHAHITSDLLEIILEVSSIIDTYELVAKFSDRLTSNGLYTFVTRNYNSTNVYEIMQKCKNIVTTKIYGKALFQVDDIHVLKLINDESLCAHLTENNIKSSLVSRSDDCIYSILTCANVNSHLNSNIVEYALLNLTHAGISRVMDTTYLRKYISIYTYNSILKFTFPFAEKDSCMHE